MLFPIFEPFQALQISFVPIKPVHLIKTQFPPSRCILEPGRALPSERARDAILRFRLNFEEGVTEAECSNNIRSINILTSQEQLRDILERAASGGRLSDSAIFQSAVHAKPQPVRAKRETGEQRINWFLK